MPRPELRLRKGPRRALQVKRNANSARQSHRCLYMINARPLRELWITHYAQLDDGARARLPLKPLWFLAGDD